MYDRTSISRIVQNYLANVGVGVMESLASSPKSDRWDELNKETEPLYSPNSIPEPIVALVEEKCISYEKCYYCKSLSHTLIND